MYRHPPKDPSALPLFYLLPPPRERKEITLTGSRKEEHRMVAQAARDETCESSPSFSAPHSSPRMPLSAS